ncbi:MAG: diguanylate cyclase [Candidatus Omnitrophica bacterium]|nr:diguanylate cyclase [Candidatus Omnitrophota bacterium]
MKKTYYAALVLVLFSIFFWFIPRYAQNSPALETAVLQTRDAFFKIRLFSSPPPAAIGDLVLLTIDEESCAKVRARWPWPRSMFAEMIRHLKERGARVVGLNISFTGLEDRGDATSLELARAMREHGNVVVGVTFDRENHLVKPSPRIAAAAARYGYLEKIMDADFLIRRSYPVRPYAGSDLFESSFPLALLAAAGHPGKSEGDIHYDGDLGWIAAGNPRRALYLDADGGYAINYLARLSDFKQIPAWRAVEGKISEREVRDKVVIVGLASSLFSDMHPTPIGILPGIAIHANEFLSLASGRALHFVPDSAAYSIAWLVAVCVLSLFLMRRFLLGSAGFVVSMAGLFLGTQIAFSRDVVIEPAILFLGPVLGAATGAVSGFLRLLIENKGLEAKVIHDKLTGLYKSDYLRDCLEQEWKRCQSSRLPVSVVMADLDRFKKINDTLGHETGNDMIKRAGEVIKESARRYDIVSRYGGDEFMILLWHAGQEEARAYRARLRRMYEAMASALDHPMLKHSSISVGVACFDPALAGAQPPSPQKLIEEADRDLLMDKERMRVPGEPSR